jgi:hypothetical protein
MRATSEPLVCNRLPFANERELQRFVVKHAKSLLGIDVVASTLRKGRPLHGIDILGVDDSGRTCIIECKHDLIDQRAIAQLVRYKEALLADWEIFAERVAEHRGAQFRLLKGLPILTVIGYRSALGLGAVSVAVFAFEYPGKSFDRFVDAQSPGVVRLAPIADSDSRSRPHPEVLKTEYAERNLAPLPAEVRRKFWAIDARLRNVDGIQPNYAGKNTQTFASYRRGRRVCIAATMGSHSITWFTIGRNAATLLTVDMGVDTDADGIFETLQRAAIAV